MDSNLYLNLLKFMKPRFGEIFFKAFYFETHSHLQNAFTFKALIYKFLSICFIEPKNLKVQKAFLLLFSSWYQEKKLGVKLKNFKKY